MSLISSTGSSRRSPTPARMAALTAAFAALGAGLPGSAVAYSGPGSFNPKLTTPLYPASQSPTPVDGWKLVHGGDVVNVQTGGRTNSASIVQIAPRWTMQSLHAGVQTGDFVVPNNGGTPVKVLRTSVLRQQPLAEGDGTARERVGGYADITLAYLESALPTPDGGLPRLLRDPVGPDIDSVLPGYVLWAGIGDSTDHDGADRRIVTHVPRVGWTRPNGLNAPGSSRVTIAGGDSGSGGLWYPTPASRPVVSSTATYGTPGALAFGRDTLFATKLAPGPTSNHATIADWMQSIFEGPLPADPDGTPPTPAEAVKPEWTTLAALDVDLAQLRPIPPRSLRITAATQTSVTISWNHPWDTRVARTGYRVYKKVGSGSEQLVAVTGATDLSATVSRTLPADQYASYIVRASNGTGLSPLAGMTRVETDVEPFPRDIDPSDASITEPDRISAAPATPVVEARTFLRFDDGMGRVDYCVEASWAKLPGIVGSPVTYEARFDGDAVSLDGTGTGLRPSRYKREPKPTAVFCGLEPASHYTFFVRGVQLADGVAGPGAWEFVTTPPGPPLGTVLPAPTLTAVTSRRVNRASGVHYCVAASWAAPPSVSDVPVSKYQLEVSPLDGLTPARLLDRPADARDGEICGLPANTSHSVRIGVHYGEEEGSHPRTAAQFTVTPTGPPVPTRLTTTFSSEGEERCVTIGWTLPASVDGSTVQGFKLILKDATADYLDSSVWLSSQASSETICGLPGSTELTASVTARFVSGVLTVGQLPFTSQP